MFSGQVPKPIKAMVHEQARSWTTTTVAFGCSGNFTSERIVASLPGQWRLLGNDVNLYSCTLGRFFAGQPQVVTVNEAYADAFGWLAPYMVDPADLATTIVLALPMARLLDKAGTVRRQVYYQRLMTAFRTQWPALHAKTKAKLVEDAVPLADFFAGDLFSWLPMLPSDAGFICYPPFFGQESSYRQYDWAKLNRLFVWDEPTYDTITPERLTELYDWLLDRPHWLIGRNVIEPRLERHLIGISKPTNRSYTIYLYGRGSPAKRIVVPHQKTEPVNLPRLTDADELGRQLQLIPLSYEQFCALRSQYMNEGIRPGKASQAFAVAVDGKLIGSFAFSMGNERGEWENKIVRPHAYLMSDFPVRPTKYRHLAKLILYAALSSEVKALIEQYVRRRVYSCVTTAYSDHPVSMKYRGLFDLIQRKQTNAYAQAWGKELPQHSAYYSRPWDLTYGAPLGRWTLQEGFDRWRKKSADRLS